MSAEAQTSSSTTVESGAPVVGNANGKKTGNGKPAVQNNSAKSGANGKPAVQNNSGKAKTNGKPAVQTNAGKATPTETAAAPTEANSGKNPVLDKISSSITELTSSIEKGNCGDVVTKAKTVIQNADPVLEAIGKQQLRENNSQLSEVKGKVRSATNSIRQKCPKGMNGSTVSAKNNTRRNNSGGIPVKKKEPTQTEVKVGQIWNVITSWAKGNERSGYDALVKITKVDANGVTFEATKIKQTAQINGMEEGEERTYSMEEWKALRKVLEEDAQGNASKNTTNTGPVGLPAVGTKWTYETRSEIPGTRNGPHASYETMVHEGEVTAVEGNTITFKVTKQNNTPVEKETIQTFSASEWAQLSTKKQIQNAQGGGKRKRRKTRKPKRKLRKSRRV